jgi:hypothetical protein
MSEKNELSKEGKINNSKDKGKESEKNNNSKKDDMKIPANDNQIINENNKKSDFNNNAKNNDDEIINSEKAKNEIINEFIDKMESNRKEKTENQKFKNNKEDKESDDPFLNAEKEYRMKHLNNNNNVNEVKNENSKNNSNLKHKSKKDNDLIHKIIYNHFKKGYSKKNDEKKYRYRPNIYKNPEKLYLKEIVETELKNIKFRSYNKTTGTFDLKKLKKNQLNFINNNKKYYDYFNLSKTSFNHNNSRLKTLNNNNFYSKYKANKEKRINSLNNKDLNFLTTEGNNFFYTSISTNSNANKPIKSLSSKFKEKQRINSKMKISKQNMINSANNKIPKKMQIYFKENNKNTKNRGLLHSTKTTYINKSAKIWNSIIDPKNPYSINFSRSLLKHYNFDISYNKNNWELGVPLLNIKSSKNRFNLNGKIKQKDRKAKTSYDYFSSRFKKFTTIKDSKSNYRYRFKNQSGKI